MTGIQEYTHPFWRQSTCGIVKSEDKWLAPFCQNQTDSHVFCCDKHENFNQFREAAKKSNTFAAFNDDQEYNVTSFKEIKTNFSWNFVEDSALYHTLEYACNMKNGNVFKLAGIHFRDRAEIHRLFKLLHTNKEIKLLNLVCSVDLCDAFTLFTRIDNLISCFTITFEGLADSISVEPHITLHLNITCNDTTLNDKNTLEDPSKEQREKDLLKILAETLKERNLRNTIQVEFLEFLEFLEFQELQD